MKTLELDRISIAYPDHSVRAGIVEAVRDVSFSLEKGKIACLLGPSGCGKTSVLRAIAGFLNIQAGEIRINGKAMASPSYALPPEKRSVGVVFQDYALFPHLTVGENVAFGLTRGRRLGPGHSVVFF